MKIKSETINEISFDFRKKETKNKKPINKVNAIIQGIIFSLVMLDIGATFYTINNQLEQRNQKLEKDINQYYSQLKSTHKEYKETKDEKLQVSVDKIKNGFAQYKPQTNVGQLMLLNEMVYFKNEYYKLSPDNPYTEKQGKEINDYLDKTITKDRFDNLDYKINCGFLISCHIIAYHLNDSFHQINNKFEEFKRKKYFELSHKEELQKFNNLSPNQKMKLYDTKQDPYSKNFW